MRTEAAASGDCEDPSEIELRVGVLNGSKELVGRNRSRLSIAPLPEEAEFYQQYSWCLNAFPTVGQLVDKLREELNKLTQIRDDWRRIEVVRNIFLLACSLTDTLDDFLAGNIYDFSKVVQVLPLASPLARIAERLVNFPRKIRAVRFSALKRWRETWAMVVTDFAQHALVPSNVESARLFQVRDCLANLLPARFPAAFTLRLPKIPAFFRSRDFTAQDCLELGQRFVKSFPERYRPVFVMGLRTAGSFLAPLVSAYLKSKGFIDVGWTAVRPKKGLAAWESSSLRQAAKKHARVLIADESIHSGQTLIQAVDLLREAGFRDDDVVMLNPVEPALPDWKSSLALQSLPHVHVITLEPAERSRQRLLESKAVEERLKEYFYPRNYVEVQVKISPLAEKENYDWRKQPPDKVDVRLKRVYEVQLQDGSGNLEVRYVLAKSVGEGWLGYHAFVAGQRLGQFVPPILGLRDGILYMEWLPQSVRLPALRFDRATLADTLGSYVAARAKALALGGNPTRILGCEGRHNGFQTLAYWLSRAYNSRVARTVQQPRIQRELAVASTMEAVMTDSKMSPEEWVEVDSRLVKTDFEHHCHGKNDLLMTDPAYDLASAIFSFALGEEETARMLRVYTEESGDFEVESRLFTNKLLTALQARDRAVSAMRHPRLFDRREEFNRQFIDSWNFLIGQTLRECGKLCTKPERIHWHAPLAVTDIDGVLDRMVFGFPLATAAGIQAISLLHAHGFTIAVNTARTLNEVKLYCRNYCFAGGVAEYGSVIWDAVDGREQVLVSPQTLNELERAREALRRIPGVFLNDDYQYSLRLYTLKDDRPTAVPALIVQDALAGLKVERLRIMHTGLDTAVVAKEIDKGSGLVALQNFVGLSRTDVFAIGDSEPDLAMFRVATRSFAPGNISCRREARLLGTWIANREYQPGLLQSARMIVHPDRSICDKCRTVAATWHKKGDLLTELLEAADQKRSLAFLRIPWETSALQLFTR